MIKEKYQSISAGEISTAVLSCVYLFPEVDLFEDRINPYLTLNSTFHKRSNYISGSNNPIFETKSGVWDCLCYLQNGNIKLSEKFDSQIDLSKSDQKFLKRVYQLMLSMQEKKCDPYEIEITLRAHFTCFSKRVLEKIRDFNFKSRIISYRQWIEKETYTNFQRKWEMELNIRKLCQMNEDEFELIQIFQKIKRELTNEESIIEFLTYFYHISDGLFPIGCYVLHKSECIRVLACWILKQIENTEIGKKYVGELNFFLFHAFLRNKSKFQMNEM